jgi:hypothetical protein
MPTDTRTDDELLAMLAQPGLWLVRGGPHGVLCTSKNLQSALIMAHEQSVARQSGWEDSDNQDENPGVAA